MNKNYDYKRLTPFKWFVLQNFPFIDEDFDAITNYQLFCKLGEEINKVIISMNLAGEQVEELTNFVNNYFDNLDVQEEINNKLDEMAQSGELAQIISQYLELNAIISFNTVNDLKNTKTININCFCKTFGKDNFNDLLGSYYKIVQKDNDVIFDDYNYIELNNFPDLMAYRVKSYYDVRSQFSYLNVNDMINDNNLEIDKIVTTAGYYNENDGGSASYIIIKNNNYDINNGKYILLNNGLVAKLIVNDKVNVKQYGAKGDGINDDTLPIQNALNDFKNIYIPSGYYNISSPIIVPSQHCSIEGSSNMGTQLTYIGEDIEEIKGFITYASDDFLWGVVINHLHLFGNNKKIHGLYFKNVAYPLCYDLNIERFNGSGILLDKCQDGSFNNCNIQLCGRQIENGEPTNNDNTLYSAIHLYSTVPNDNCNMLRFNDCQIENNNCSPYVFIADGIGLQFVNCHGEVRNENQFGTRDFLKKNGGDVEILGCNLSQFRYGIVDNGYGSISVSNGRSIGSYITTADDVTNSHISFVNTVMGDIIINARNISNFTIDNCIVSNLNISYPSGNIWNITNSLINAINQTFVGNPRATINYSNNKISGNVSITGECFTKFFDNHTVGNVSISGGYKYYYNNITNGNESVDYIDARKFLPSKRRECYGTDTPYGSWNNGDIMWNDNPATGKYVGWVRTSEGWKGFGLIS